mmetsp:Transcript_115813/g.227164  ORF Transcript_115813/g.227164 Transcript_115813/m.227164 type:complete len:104 (+) Transcript_115813:298-609(+)
MGQQLVEREYLQLDQRHEEVIELARPDADEGDEEEKLSPDVPRHIKYQLLARAQDAQDACQVDQPVDEEDHDQEDGEHAAEVAGRDFLTGGCPKNEDPIRHVI